MAFFTLPDAAVGPIAASLVGAVLGYLGLVISKESKTSEFRQAWIDSLRSDLADVVANGNLLRGALTIQYADSKEAFDAVSEILLAFNRAEALVRLRLNPSEAHCEAILDSIRKLETLIKATPIDLDACQKQETELLSRSQFFLKQEWHRVRKGETVFFVSKIVAAVTSILMITALLLTWIFPPATTGPSISPPAPGATSVTTTNSVGPNTPASAPPAKPNAQITAPTAR